MIWLRLWWYAVRHGGLWADPKSTLLTLGQTIKVIFVLKVLR